MLINIGFMQSGKLVVPVSQYRKRSLLVRSGIFFNWNKILQTRWAKSRYTVINYTLYTYFWPTLYKERVNCKINMLRIYAFCFWCFGSIILTSVPPALSVLLLTVRNSGLADKFSIKFDNVWLK